MDLITKLSVSGQFVPNLTLSGGLLRFKHRVWLGTNTSMQLQVMKALHDSPIGGHSGFPVTYKKIKRLFY